MGEQELGHEKKLPRIRRYSTIGAIRREVLRCYEELRQISNADPVEIQRSRALGYLLSTAGELLKAEKLEDIEKRLDNLEIKTNKKVTNMTKHERRIERIEQCRIVQSDAPACAEVINLIEELSGEKMTEEQKLRPEKRGGPLDPEVKALINEICNRHD